MLHLIHTTVCGTGDTGMAGHELTNTSLKRERGASACKCMQCVCKGRAHLCWVVLHTVVGVG